MSENSVFKTKEEILDRLHTAVGVCDVCGKAGCACYHPNTTLPDTLKTDDVIKAIDYEGRFDPTGGIGMKWLSIKKDGVPDDNNNRLLTYSAHLEGYNVLAYRLIESQFIKFCSEVTHYLYLTPPDNDEV